MGQPDSKGQKDEDWTGLSCDSRTARDRRMKTGQGCHVTARQRGTEGEDCMDRVVMGQPDIEGKSDEHWSGLSWDSLGSKG
jgi:hypothetical protein